MAAYPYAADQDEKAEMKMTALTAPGTCRVCGHSNAGHTVQVCPACQAPHHQDCWDYAGQCATFGCGYSPLVLSMPQDGSPARCFPAVPWDRQTAFAIVLRNPAATFLFMLNAGLLHSIVLVCMGVQASELYVFGTFMLLFAVAMAVLSIPFSVLLYLLSYRESNFRQTDAELPEGIIRLEESTEVE